MKCARTGRAASALPHIGRSPAWVSSLHPLLDGLVSRPIRLSPGRHAALASFRRRSALARSTSQSQWRRDLSQTLIFMDGAGKVAQYAVCDANSAGEYHWCLTRGPGLRSERRVRAATSLETGASRDSPAKAPSDWRFGGARCRWAKPVFAYICRYGFEMKMNWAVSLASRRPLPRPR